MNDKLLIETAVLAGEIMLVSGAEIYRVEDTINRILKKANRRTTEAIVFSTGIFATLNDPLAETITVARRVTNRSFNLNRVYLANDISRKLCDDLISVEDAYQKLHEVVGTVQYRSWLKCTAMVAAVVFFSLLLGGGPPEWLAAALVGGVLALVTALSWSIRLNDFCRNAVSAFLIAVVALGIQYCLIPGVNSDLIIISSIMPLVPGMIFTTAIRDTLNGDYASGTARMLEAVVIALAVAVGVGSGIAVFGYMTGGVLL